MSYEPPRAMTDEEVEAFHKEADEIRAARVWANANGFEESAIETPYTFFHPNRWTRQGQNSK